MKTATGEVTDKVAIHGIEAKDPNKKSHLDMIIPSVIDSDTGILHKRALVRLALELRAYGVVIDPKKYSDVIYTTKKEDIEIEKLAKEVMSIAEKSLEKESIKSNKYLTVLSSDFMSNILSRMIPLFSSEQVRKKAIKK